MFVTDLWLDNDMTNTATNTRPIDANQALAALRPARMEMGIRDAKTTGTALYFKVGMGPSTSWVEVTVSSLDLYDVVVFKLRGTTRTELATLSGIYAEDLARGLIDRWCEVCSRKGW